MASTIKRPRNLKRYRRIVNVLAKHGFGSMLEYIRVQDRISLPKRLLKQTATPRLSPAEHFRLALEELGPTFIKMGQILSTRPDILPVDFIAELSKLQDDAPPVPWEVIRTRLEGELGDDLDHFFSSINQEPLASASLAQVHAGVLVDGTQVVVKVQRPDVLPVIERDLDILRNIAALAQRTSVGEVTDVVELVEDFALTLLSELDYRREGRSADRFRENFAHEPYIYVPEIYWEFSTQRLLVMERIQGIKIDDIQALEAAGYDRHQLALNSARLIIKEILEDGFFHGDPHPGNLIVMPGEKIGAMDFGIVGRLRDQDRQNLIRLYLAGTSKSPEEIVEELIRFGSAPADVDRISLAKDFDRMLVKYSYLPLKDIRAREVIEDFMPISRRYHLVFPADMWLLLKTVSMMEGIGIKLDPDFDIFSVGEQYAKRIAWQLVMPKKSWSQILIRQSSEWGELLTSLPRTGNRLLQQAESGELLQFSFKDTNRIISFLDQLTTRLTLSILASALIVALAMLIPVTTSGSLVQWIVIVGFLGAAGLGVRLLISMRKRVEDI